MSNLKATKRENLSSGSNNRLRANGLIPAILYGGKNPNQNISVSKKDISNINKKICFYKFSYYAKFKVNYWNIIKSII